MNQEINISIEHIKSLDKISDLIKLENELKELNKRSLKNGNKIK